MTKQKGFSIVEWMLILSVGAIIIALLATFIVQTNPKNKASTQSKSNTAPASKVHKVPLPDISKTNDTILKPGDALSTGVITFKYLGLEEDFYVAGLITQPGTRYIKVNFDLKRGVGSGTFNLLYYPDVLPEQYSMPGGITYGSVDYGVYDESIDDGDKVRTDPLTGSDVRTKKIKIAGEQSYEQVFGSHNHNIDENYRLYDMFEVAKEDSGYVSLRIDDKSYRLTQ